MLRALCLGFVLFGCAGAAKPTAQPQPTLETKSEPAPQTQASVACEGPNCTPANVQPPCDGPNCAPAAPPCEGINCPPPAQAGTTCPKDAKADDPRCSTQKPMLELK